MLPAYMKIHDQIKKDIDEHRWAIGERLPSERDLAEQFAVSRMTLRQAVSLLVFPVLEYKKRCEGQPVLLKLSNPKVKFPLASSFPTKKPFEEGVLERRVGSGTFPNEQEVAKLGIFPTDNIIRMERVRYADQVPLVYEVASIPEKFIKDFKKEEITSHFFQTLQKYGYRIGKSQQTIYARLAKEKIAHYLEVEKGHAILGLTQVSYLEDGTAFEYVKSQYVGERFEFYLENN